MRKTLTAAAALAPLLFAAGESAAQTTTTISNSTSTPVATATASSGSAADISIVSGGTINLTSPGAAVTLNSNNTVTNTGGLIQSSDINNATGILVVGGNTGTVDNGGTIALKDSASPSTDSTTGVTQAPWAPNVNGVAPTSRIGIWVSGTSAFTGNVINDADGVIDVTGNQSYGIRVDAPIIGSLENGGSITMVGDNSAGILISSAGSISAPAGSAAVASPSDAGSVYINGAISATGQNSSAVVVNGSISGRFSLYSSATATAYGTTTRSVSNVIQADIQNATNGTETEKGGPAVVLGGSIGQGVYIGAAPANTVSTSTADLDGDGVEDGIETSGSAISYGNQPGLVIGAAGSAVNIGTLQLTSTSSNSNMQGYGVVISGAVTGTGVEDGVSAVGIQIGAVTANSSLGPAGAIGAIAASTSTGAATASGSTVNIAGGLYINTGGTVSASANGADAVGIHILGGSTVPTIGVDGTLSADVAQPLPNATSGVATPYNGSSYGLVIEQGATVNTLNVGGALTATTNGDGAVNSGFVNNATAVVDYSGTLSKVNVTGTISATITPTVSTVTPIGTTTALDLSANTSGAAIVMNQAPQTQAVAVTSNGVTTTTTTTLSSVVYNYTGAAITATSTSGNTTTTTTTPVAPTITGAVYLGSGANSFDMEAGTFSGLLSVNEAGTSYEGLAATAAGLTSSAASTMAITLNNSAVFTGPLEAPSNTIFTFNINSGTFTDTAPLALNATTLHVGSTGVFSFAIDPANNRNTSVTTTGAVTLDSGAKIGINVLSNLTGTETVTLITAGGGLTVGGTTANLTGDVPYLFAASASQSGNELNLTIREKTPSELGMNSAEGAALPAIYNALPLNSTIQSAVFGQYDKGSFFKIYDQLMPDYSGGLFRAASEASRTISRLTADPNQIENPTGSRGAWAQQFFVGSYQGRDGSTTPYQAGGFGYAGGVETGGLGFGAVGATAAFIAINESNPQSPTDDRTSLSQLELGLYWQGELGGLTLDARVGAGYDWFSGRRQFITFDSAGTINYNIQTKSNWNGYDLTGHFGAAYQIDLWSNFFIRPQVQADYFRMNQNAYNEHDGASGFNLALDSTTGEEASASALMAFGAKFGRTVVWRPELQLGVRDVFTGNPGAVDGHFIGGTTAFNIDTTEFTGPSGVARIKFKGSSEYYEVGIEGGVEGRSRYSEADAKLAVRVLF